MIINAVFILMSLLAAAPVLAENKPPTKSQASTIKSTTNLQTGIESIFVPGGCFRMGSDNGNSDEKPVHEVCVSDFYIGRYEVTQGQWFKIMGSNPSRFNKCGEECPVEQVSSSDAMDFIDRLNRLSGKNYRLPTEAEWEYACRSGGKNELFCGGNNSDEIAWYDKNSSARTHPAGQKKPNGLGVFDMSGNVWEWVSDWKGDYPVARQQNPAGPSGSTRMRRGGSWQYGTGHSHATWRSSGYPDDRALDIGFRLVLPSP